MQLGFFDEGTGRHTVTYSTQLPGYYNLSVFLEQNNTQVPVYLSSDKSVNSAVRSRSVRVTPSFIEAINSLLDLSGMGNISVSATGSSSFMILPKDEFDNNLTEADVEGWSIVIATGAGSIFDFSRQEIVPRLETLSYPPEEEVEQWMRLNPSRLEGNKYFKVDYDIGLSAGIFEGMATFRGAQIRGSPFSFVIRPGPVGASDVSGLALRQHTHRCTVGFNRCTYIQGLGLQEGIQFDITDQTKRSFQIVPRDIYGNDISDPIGILGLEGAAACGNVVDRSCPFRVILNHPSANQNWTSLVGWSGYLEGGDQDVIVKLQPDGTFLVVLSYALTGRYRVFVSLHTTEDQNYLEPVPTYGMSVGYSPSSCAVVAGRAVDFYPADASESYAYGDGLKGGLAGSAIHLAVQAVKLVCIDGDKIVAVARGEACPGSVVPKAAPRGGETFGVVITEPNAGPVDTNFVGSQTLTDITVTDNDDGTYGVRYTLQKAGSYVLNVTLHNKAIVGFDIRPKVITVLPGETSPAQSTIEGVPSTTTLYVGVRAIFYIIARDQFGNRQQAKQSQLLPDVFEVKVELSKDDPELPGQMISPFTVDQVRGV